MNCPACRRGDLEPIIGRDSIPEDAEIVAWAITETMREVRRRDRIATMDQHHTLRCGTCYVRFVLARLDQ